MGVKVKLTAGREVGGKKYRAGDVVEVEPGDARVLVALGVGTKVDDGTAVAKGEPVAGTAGGSNTSKSKKAATSGGKG